MLDTRKLNLPLLAVALLGLFVALYIGVLIGEAAYVGLTVITAIIGVVASLTFLQGYTWQIALGMCYVGLIFRPLGFDFGPMELSCSLGLLFLFVTGWQNKPSHKSVLSAEA